MPCSEKRARLLLERGRARVHKMAPFTIRVVDLNAKDCAFQELRVKLDPGSKTTGIALVRVHPFGWPGGKEKAQDSSPDDNAKGKDIVVISLFELVHRGRQISEALTARRAHRRLRRSKLRYRPARFNNRGGDRKGWLAPSLQHRVDTTEQWVKRLQRLAPIKSISTELVRFDMQAMDNPEIEGAQYQQGTLAGYEVREYLLEKWNRTCAYCGVKDVPLQVEHIHAKSKGGSNRISNLTLACQSCNHKKGILPVEVFLSKKPDLLKKILAQAKKPLKDAAAVNATRLALWNKLKETGLPVETSSGGRTKFNRFNLNVPKTHALDAACVGEVASIEDWKQPTLCIKAMGRGSYQRTRLDKYGCVRSHLTREKSIKGFQTGDMVKAIVPTGVKAGTHAGRVAVRASGSFNIQTSNGVVQGVSHRHCKVVQRGDGYGYQRVVQTWT